MLVSSVCRKLKNSDERKKDLNKWKDIWCSWIDSVLLRCQFPQFFLYVQYNYSVKFDTLMLKLI